MADEHREASDAWWERRLVEAEHEAWLKGRRESIERELGVCQQAVEAGVTRALADAVRLCRNNKIVLPRWLMIALVEFILRNQQPQEIKAYLDDMADDERHDAVLELRERASELCESALRMPAEDRDEMQLLLIGGWRPGAPQGEQLTLDACFDVVALRFKVSRDAIKASYYRVERDIAAGKRSGTSEASSRDPQDQIECVACGGGGYTRLV